MYIMILSQIKLEWQNENGKQYDKKQNQNEYRMLDGITGYGVLSPGIQN